MAIINYAAREMTAKIVYYGPGLSGKTTSIQYIHTKISPANKGKLVSLATETDRTLFFDFFPVDFGQIGGFRVKFNFYTVPGQVFYNTTRKLVLKGADGVVFVADSQEGMKEQNIESLKNLHENLKIHGVDPATVPFVIQFNKRDIPGAMSVEQMRRDLNPGGVPDFETDAVRGDGVMDAMKQICKMVLEDLRNKQKSQGAQQSKASAPAQQPKAAKAETPSAEKPTAQPPSAPAQATGTVEATSTVMIPVERAGTFTTNLAVPLTLTVPPGVDRLSVSVSVSVTFNQVAGAKAQVSAPSAPAAEPPASEAQAEPPKKKGFLSRLFGGD